MQPPAQQGEGKASLVGLHLSRHDPIERVYANRRLRPVGSGAVPIPDCAPRLVGALFAL